MSSLSRSFFPIDKCESLVSEFLSSRSLFSLSLSLSLSPYLLRACEYAGTALRISRIFLISRKRIRAVTKKNRVRHDMEPVLSDSYCHCYLLENTSISFIHTRTHASKKSPCDDQGWEWKRSRKVRKRNEKKPPRRDRFVRYAYSYYVTSCALRILYLRLRSQFTASESEQGWPAISC